MSVNPVLSAKAGAWDGKIIYRSCLVAYDGKDGAPFGLYYSAQSQAGTWNIAYADVLSGRALSETPSKSTPNRFAAGQRALGDSKNIHPNPTMLVAATGAIVPTGFVNNLIAATGHGWDETTEAHTWSLTQGSSGSVGMTCVIAPAVPFVAQRRSQR